MSNESSKKKVRVWELNKEAGVPTPSKELVKFLHTLGYLPKSSSSALHLEPLERLALVEAWRLSWTKE